MAKIVTKEELLAKAKKPAEDAMKIHPFYKGKTQVALKAPVRDYSDFAIHYTPGVAEPCKAIEKNKDLVYQHTNKGNFIAVLSDCTRVLGLGDIGPEAGMPVMEGKALLFKYLGGVDAIPLCIGPNISADQMIQFVKMIQPTFGGINLEDIESPKCFEILDTLRKDPEVTIPVWHDDRQGTACVTLAGLINALKVVGKKFKDVKVVFLGYGASNYEISHLLFEYGVDPKKTIICDSKGIIHKDRTDIEDYKKPIAKITNGEDIRGGPAEALKGADVLIALSKPGPDTVKPEWIKSMNKDSVVFVCANPIPEIWPWVAKEAGARVVATGRSDFPNQVNNSLGFPSIFRGTLDVNAKTITDGMCIRAAEELAKYAEEKGLSDEYIIPKMDEQDVFYRVSAAVGMQAIQEGVARITRTYEELYEMAKHSIGEAQRMTKVLMDTKIIPPFKE